MKAWLVVLVVLTSVAVQAQPQAPVVWGPIRLLQQAPDTLQCRDIYAHGDTLALLGFRPMSGGSLYPAASVTGNNGLTWSPWHVFWTQGGAIEYAGGAVTSSALCIVTGTPDGTGRGIYRSTDLGISWMPPSVSLVGLRPLAQLGDTIFCVARYDSVTWTANGGVTFAPLRRSEARPYSQGHAGIRSLSVSSNRVHTFAIGNVEGDFRWHVLYSAASLLDGPFTPVERLNPDIFSAYATDAEFDRNGTGILASIVMYSLPVPDWGAVVVNTTRDDGETWSAPDTITAGETADPFYVYVRHCGPLWVVAWMDSNHVAPFAHGGGWIRFSANWGRSWYPIQQAYDDHETFGGDLCEADIGPDYIRLYEAMRYWNDVPGWYYFQWEGTIRRDTLAPVIAEGSSVPQIVPMDTTLCFSMDVSDDDSLWLTQVVLRNLESGDSLILDLERQSSLHFGLAWTVPSDTADWNYYYRAEDMWENVTYVPSEGPAAPWTFHVGPLSTSDDFIPHPSSLSLSVFPNPFNSTTQIEFTLPSTQRVSLRLYDVLGREVAVMMNEIRTAGKHEMMFDAAGLASGVYLCRLEAGGMGVARKMVLVK